MDAKNNLTNAKNINDLHILLDRLIGEIAHRGTFASVSLTFSVSDGIIQDSSVQGEAKKLFRPIKAQQKRE